MTMMSTSWLALQPPTAIVLLLSDSHGQCHRVVCTDISSQLPLASYYCGSQRVVVNKQPPTSAKVCLLHLLVVEPSTTLDSTRLSWCVRAELYRTADPTSSTGLPSSLLLRRCCLKSQHFPTSYESPPVPESELRKNVNCTTGRGDRGQEMFSKSYRGDNVGDCRLVGG